MLIQKRANLAKIVELPIQKEFIQHKKRLSIGEIESLTNQL